MDWSNLLSTYGVYGIVIIAAVAIAFLFRYIWNNKKKALLYLPIAEKILKSAVDNTEDNPDSFDMHDAISIVHSLAHYASETVSDPQNAKWDDIKDEIVSAVKDGLKTTSYGNKLSDEWIERIAAGALITAEHLPKIVHGEVKLTKPTS